MHVSARLRFLRGITRYLLGLCVNPQLLSPTELLESVTIQGNLLVCNENQYSSPTWHSFDSIASLMQCYSEDNW